MHQCIAHKKTHAHPWRQVCDTYTGTANTTAQTEPGSDDNFRFVDPSRKHSAVSHAGPPGRPKFAHGHELHMRVSSSTALAQPSNMAPARSDEGNIRRAQFSCSSRRSAFSRAFAAPAAEMLNRLQAPVPPECLSTLQHRFRLLPSLHTTRRLRCHSSTSPWPWLSAH